MKYQIYYCPEYNEYYINNQDERELRDLIGGLNYNAEYDRYVLSEDQFQMLKELNK